MNSANNSSVSVILVVGIIAMTVVVGIARSRSAHGRNVAPSSILQRREPTPSHHEAVVGAPFDLAAVERSVIGVQHDGDRVTFRASGNQWGVSVSLVVGAGLATVVVAVRVDGLLWLLPLIGAACLLAWTALLLRVRVCLTPEGLLVQGRYGKAAVYRWDRVEAVRVEIQESSGLWLRGAERPTVAQGVVSVDGEWLNLPGFRCTIWAADKFDDPLNNTDLKVGIVIRYRATFAGEWRCPKP
ncbi:MAG: hypothetical protein WCO88_14355 [Actinomycetota bacterium]